MSPSTLPMPNISNFELYGANGGPRTPQTPQTTGPPSVASSHGGGGGGYMHGGGGPPGYETQGSNPAFPPSSTPDIINSLHQMNVVSPPMLTADGSYANGGPPVPSPLANVGVTHPNSVDNSQRHGTPNTPQCPPSVGAVGNPLTPQSVGVQQQASCPGTPASVGVIVGPPSVSTAQPQQQQQTLHTPTSASALSAASAYTNSSSDVGTTSVSSSSAAGGSSATAALTTSAGDGATSAAADDFSLPELSFDADAIINGTGPQDLDVSENYSNILFEHSLKLKLLAGSSSCLERYASKLQWVACVPIWNKFFKTSLTSSIKCERLLVAHTLTRTFFWLK